MRLILTTLFFILLYAFASKAAPIWDGGALGLQTYKNGLYFGNTKSIQAGSGDFVFDSSGQFNGPLRIEESAEPSTPGFGLLSLFYDSTTKELKKKDNDGNSLPIDFNEIDEVNLLKNRSFELADADFSWDYFKSGASTASVETSIVLEGKQSIVLNPSSETFDFSQTISIDQYDGKVVGFSCEINSTENVDVCFMEGANELSCKTKNLADKWTKVEVLGSVISGNTYGIRVKSDVAITDNVYIDKCEFTSNPLNFKDGLERQTYSITQAGNAMTDRAAEIQYNLGTATISNKGANLISAIDDGANTRTQFVANKDLTATFAFQAFAAVNSNGADVFKNGSRIKLGNGAGAGEPASNTVRLDLNAGDFISFSVNGGVQNNANESNLIISAEAGNPQIIENADIVSSENISFNFKSTAIDCDVDPIGTYNTFGKTSNSNTFNLCATDANNPPNNNDGIRIGAAPWTGSRVCPSANEQPMYRICVGKGLKGLVVHGYSGTNRSGLTVDHILNERDASNRFGMYKHYNESEGYIELNAGTSSTSANSNAAFYPLGGGALNNAYFHFALSKNPIVNAIDAVPRVDYSWENNFSARIDSAGNLVSENTNFISSTSRTALGQYTINFNAGFFSQIPKIELTATANRCIGYVTLTTTTLTLQTRQCDNAAFTDVNFEILASRQGSDYRSRGDAAAIIAQPSCYLKQKRTQGTQGGSTVANSWTARPFDSVVTGDCSFLTTGVLTADATYLSGTRFSDFDLAKGSYLIEGKSQYLDAGTVKTAIYNNTSAAFEPDTISDNLQGSGSISVTQSSDIKGTINITQTSNFEYQYNAQTIQGTNGLGPARNLAGIQEIYVLLKITKIK